MTRWAPLLSWITAVSIMGCGSTKVNRQFCLPGISREVVADIVDPEGWLDSPDVPEALRASVLRYIFGAICGKPACDLFTNKLDVKACEDGYLDGRSILHKKVLIDEVAVGAAIGFAVVSLVTPDGNHAYSAIFRRSVNGSWFVFDPLQEGW